MKLPSAGTVTKFATFADNIVNGTNFSGSLTAYAKSTMVSSRVVIQNSCSQEEILPDLLQTLQQIYVSFILSAVNLSAYVDNSRTTVKNMMQIIASEDFNKPFVKTKDIIDGLESFTPNAIPKFAVDTDGFASTAGNPDTIGGSKIVDTPAQISLPSGRVVEITFNVGGEQKNKVTTNILVNLFPQIIPDTVAQSFFNINIKPDFFERLFKWRSGEISFWSDFLFELDLRQKRKDVIKKDNSGLLLDLEQQKSSKLGSRVWNGLMHFLGVKQLRQNVANTIYVYNKPDFDVWAKKNRIDFRSASSRNSFMSRTMSMMVVVIDSDFQKVDLYFNGIDSFGEYNFNQIKVQSKGEKYDLVSIMKSLSAANAPRF